MTDSLISKNYPSAYSLVEEFHRTYGQAIRTVPQLDIPEKAMRVELIVEEAEELEVANRENDFIEIADALADLLYVTYGAALAHGIKPDELLLGNKTPVSLVRLETFLQNYTLPTKPTIHINIRNEVVAKVSEAAEIYKQASEHGTIDAVEAAIVNLIKISYAASLAFGLDIDAVLEEVQRSNMSKLDKNGLPIYREDGKVLKGPNFFVPDVTAVLEKTGMGSYRLMSKLIIIDTPQGNSSTEYLKVSKSDTDGSISINFSDDSHGNRTFRLGNKDFEAFKSALNEISS